MLARPFAASSISPTKFDCGAKWAITVDHGVSPTALPATLDASATAGAGEMVLVRITWTRDLWSFIDAVEDDTESDDDEAVATPGLMTLVAIGLARSRAHELIRPCPALFFRPSGASPAPAAAPPRSSLPSAPSR